MLTVAVFVACSDEDTTAPPPPPDPGPEPATGGTIGVYADVAGTDLNIIDTGELVQVYVIHKTGGGSTASQFKIIAPAGWTEIGAWHQMELHIGTFYRGIAYAYGDCKEGTIHLATVTYQSPGNTNGEVFEVAPADRWNQVRVVDCNENIYTDGEGLTSPVSTP
jgi:hypothetical protein